MFLFGCAGPSLLSGLFSGSGAPPSHCGGFSCGRALGLWLLGFSSHSTWAHQLQLLGSRAQAQKLWHMGLVAPWHLESSWIRDLICVSCIGRQILYHWTTREAPQLSFKCIEIRKLRTYQHRYHFYSSLFILFMWIHIFIWHHFFLPKEL